MDSISRASSFYAKQKRIMIPFNTSKIMINKIIKKDFIIERSFVKTKRFAREFYQKKMYTYFN